MAKKKKSYSKGKIQKDAAKRMVNSALKDSGKGSVTRTWGKARNAMRAGNLGLAVSLGNIAKRKSSFARSAKR